jgi:SnoaL-like protein
LTPNLPPAVAHLIAAANANDTTAFLDCFPANGTVDDWGREFTGPDAIRAWSDGEFIGVQVRLDVTAVEETPDGTTVTAQVGGNGFNGPSHFTFRVAGDLVERMTIRA